MKSIKVISGAILLGVLSQVTLLAQSGGWTTFSTSCSETQSYLDKYGAEHCLRTATGSGQGCISGGTGTCQVIGCVLGPWQSC